MKEKLKRIEARVTPQEKAKLENLAQKCGLPQSEYIRQRVLGYSPKSVLPSTFNIFYEKLCELSNSIDGAYSPQVEEKILDLIDNIQSELILPAKQKATQIKTELKAGG